MKISTGKPPNNLVNRCREAFGNAVDFDKGVVFTYGDTVYCKLPLSEDLKVHEGIHITQQANYGVEDWWNRYLGDKPFRLAQEIEAYKNQLDFARKNYNRKMRKHLEKHIYYSMATLYGFDITEKEAEKLLK